MAVLLVILPSAPERTAAPVPINKAIAIVATSMGSLLHRLNVCLYTYFHMCRGPMSTQTKPEVAAAVQLWTSFLEGLQRLQDDLEADKPAAARASIAGVFDTLRKVDDLPAKLPDITWSDLILRQKVC